jgi:hypothetical protein
MKHLTKEQRYEIKDISNVENRHLLLRKLCK